MDFLFDMNRTHAQYLMEDIEKSLNEIDYSEDLYLSIKNAGTTTFKKCAYHEVEDYIFIWTKTEKFLINKKEIGDHVLIPYNSVSQITLKTVT